MGTSTVSSLLQRKPGLSPSARSSASPGIASRKGMHIRGSRPPAVAVEAARAKRPNTAMPFASAHLLVRAANGFSFSNKLPLAKTFYTCLTKYKKLAFIEKETMSWAVNVLRLEWGPVNWTSNKFPTCAKTRLSWKRELSPHPIGKEPSPYSPVRLAANGSSASCA